MDLRRIPPLLSRFRADERGAISLDWLVLSAAMAGTGLAVMGTVTTGLEGTSTTATAQLRGQVMQRSFGTRDLCADGLAGVRAREAGRVAAGGADPIDVATWLPAYAVGLSDADLRAERVRLGRRTTAVWTRDDTLRGLLDCGLARRGI